MPKLKTKSSTKGRFRVTGTGKVKGNFAFKRHNLRKRSTSMKRKARGSFVLAEPEQRAVRAMMPYAK